MSKVKESIKALFICTFLTSCVEIEDGSSLYGNVNGDEFLKCGIKNKNGTLGLCPQYLGAGAFCVCATNSCAILNQNFDSLESCKYIYVSDARYSDISILDQCVEEKLLDNSYGYLDPQGQRCIYKTPYNNVSTDMSVVDMSVVDMPAVDMSAVDMSAVDMSAVDMSAVDMSAVDMSAVDMRTD